MRILSSPATSETVRLLQRFSLAAIAAVLLLAAAGLALALLRLGRLEDFADSGYGQPQGPERETLAREGDRLTAAWREQADWLRDEARAWLSPERLAALDATDANVKALGEQLRRLHRDQGGVEL